MNRRAKIKSMTTLACAIVHARGGGCVMRGSHEGKLEAHHWVPRSRGWQYATDPENISLVCTRHHVEIPKKRLQPEYIDAIVSQVQDKYAATTPHPVTDDEIRERADQLSSEAELAGVEIPSWMRRRQ